MTLHHLPFGHIDLPDFDQVPAEPRGKPARLIIRLPRALRSGVEQAAARAGVKPDDWVLSAVASSLDRPSAA